MRKLKIFEEKRIYDELEEELEELPIHMAS